MWGLRIPIHRVRQTSRHRRINNSPTKARASWITRALAERWLPPWKLIPSADQLTHGGVMARIPSLARAEWLEKRQAELLPAPYFHVVFTLPESLAAIRPTEQARDV
jgi:hypothetical protein